MSRHGKPSRSSTWVLALLLCAVLCAVGAPRAFAAPPDKTVVDCQIAPTADPVLPPEAPMMEVGPPTRITPPFEVALRGAVWAPGGEAIAFVAPTADIFPLEPEPTVEDLDGSALPVGVSRNEIWIYELATGEWTQVTDDGSQPQFADDGQHLLFLQNVELMAYERATVRLVARGARGADGARGRLAARPLRDGTLVAPDPLSGKTREMGREARWPDLDLQASDRLIASPDSKRVVVDRRRRGDHASQLELYGPNGKKAVLLQNCPSSGTQITWSPTSREVAYPLALDLPELHVLDVITGKDRTVARFPAAGRLSGLTLSPAGQEIAFVLDDEQGRRLGILETQGKGLQWVGSGILPNWSPSGDRLLYAQALEGDVMEWYVVTLTPGSGSQPESQLQGVSR